MTAPETGCSPDTATVGSGNLERRVRPIASVDRRLSHAALRARWLVRVRWSAVLGQLAAIAIAEFGLDFDIPTPWLLLLCAFAGGTNVALARRLRRGWQLGEGATATVLLLDTLVLTGLLLGTGGPSNPFTILYLVQITVAAVMLGARATWLVAAAAVTCYALLFVLPYVPLETIRHDGRVWTYPVHLVGMGVALSTAAALVAFFVTRLSAAIAERDAQLTAIRERTSRHERLAALTTLAAGAAHELATPMSTIAVTARELERALGRLGDRATERLLDDARLIRSEVDRCARILHGMSGFSAPFSPGEGIEPAADRLVDAILREIGVEQAGRVAVTCRSAAADVEAPSRPLVSGVVNLVRNGLDAAPEGAPVALTIDLDGTTLAIRVRDQGPGMTPDVLARAGEPFFTTKLPGHGLGLGLFLTRTIAESAGGRLTLESSPDGGTLASLELPITAARHAGVDHAAAL